MTLLRLICISIALSNAACTRLPSPEASGELVVGIRATPAFYQLDGDKAEGFEHDLTLKFAQSLGLKIRFLVASNPSELRQLLTSGQIHLAASMPLVPNPSDGMQPLAVSIRKVPQWIVAHDELAGLDTLDDLPGQTVAVAEGSAQAHVLRGLQETQRPIVIEHKSVNEFDLLATLKPLSGLVATDDIHLSLANNVYPELDGILQLPGKAEFGWVFAGSYGAKLQAQAQAFIDQARKDGNLARTNDRYFGHIKRIKPDGVSQLFEDIATRLPAYRHHFQQAQALSGLDWRLLAALAYQESKWDPLATSATNVRGIMMLTEGTADYLGVSNRLDARESIIAGARYLAELTEQVPATAHYPDRLWLALSAYNLGMGHFNGARAIAKGMKRNADSWYEMKAVLPTLSKPEVYARLKSGRARGGEAVIMVENIRTYYDILCRLEAPLTGSYAVTKPGPNSAPALTLR